MCKVTLAPPLNTSVGPEIGNRSAERTPRATDEDPQTTYFKNRLSHLRLQEQIER